MKLVLNKEQLDMIVSVMNDEADLLVDNIAEEEDVELVLDWKNDLRIMRSIVEAIRSGVVV